MPQTRTFPIPGEAAVLEPEVRVLLQEVGAALDERRPLQVHVHGVVALDRRSAAVTTAGEKDYAGQAQRRPATRSWKGPPRREGAAHRSWSAETSRPRSASSSSRVGSDDLREAYEGQVTSLGEAYPTVQTFADENGMWLLAESSIISGLQRKAIFLVALPYRSQLGPRAWGFWATAAKSSRWMGPRHTNFQDGSICAFSPDDGVWNEGGDLRTLLDLYSVWALRHLYLETFGRWPGKQYTLVGAAPIVQAYYRQMECKDDELCGCGSETRRYADCCKASDLRWNLVDSAVHFFRCTGGFDTRRPPSSVLAFIEGRSDAPKIADVHLQFNSVA